MKDNLKICSYRDFLFNYLRKKFPRARYEDIEDSVQNTLIKAVRFHHTWQKNSSLKTWLSVIAVNMYIDNFRKRYVKHEFLIESDESIYLFDSIVEEDFSETFCENDYLKYLVDELLFENENNVHIEAFKLNVMDDIDYKDIAILQNIPIGTVKSRVFRGRKLLQDKYQQICQQEDSLLV